MSKYFRLARLIEIAVLIKYHPAWGPKKLAEYFGISEKRLYDDLNELNAANIPIVYNGKGYSFLTPQSLPPVQFTLDEALSLLIGSTALEGRFEAKNSPAVRSATTKLIELLPETTRNFLLEISGKVKLDSKGRAKSDPALKLLNQAIAEKKTVSLKYQAYSSGAVTKRDVDPLGLVFRGNSWYMIGYCHKRAAIRTFRLNRISGLCITSSIFNYPEDFSIEKHLEKSWQIFQGEETAVSVLFSPKIAPLILEHQWQPEQHVENHPDGSITYTTIVKGTLEIQRWILSWGAEAEALAPESLRDEMTRITARMSQSYRTGAMKSAPSPAAGKTRYGKLDDAPQKLVAEKPSVYKTRKPGTK